MLDVIVDGHLDTLQAMDDRIEEIEDSSSPTSRRWTCSGRRTTSASGWSALRKLVTPMRDVVGALQHHVSVRHGGELAERYQDLDDHAIRVNEWSDGLRDLITTIFETNLSLADARLNQVVKRLSGWAAIIAVPTAITGFYGQNVPYPGFGQWWGFIVSSTVTVLLAGGI